MSALVAVFLGVVVLVLFVYAVFVIGRRLIRDDGRLRLVDRLRGQGLALPATKNEAVLRAGAFAVRRCVACAGHARCDELLAARDWDALREICPNTPYIDSLRPR